MSTSCADGRELAICPPLHPDEWRPGAGVVVPSNGARWPGGEERRGRLYHAPEKRDRGGWRAQVKGLEWV